VKLTAQLIIKAYLNGFFPMDTEQQIQWYSPDPRCVIDLDDFHISRRLARKYKQDVFAMNIDTAWDKVLFHCSNRQETWISDEIKEAYTELYRMGLAHSIEAFAGNELAGGLYGVSLGGAFMAESMFHIATDASKFCLIYLVERLKKNGFVLLDVQYLTSHLARFGAKLVPRSVYLDRLKSAVHLECRFK
jgi:leucyl/phenylalanyl-tRNA---protein transferase